MTDRDRSTAYAEVAAIVARIPLDVASREMAGALRTEVAALDRLPGDSQADVLEGVRRNLRRWWRWLSTGVAPTDEDFEPLRDWARARASEGVRLEDLLRAFGVGRQVGWGLIRRHAREHETDALVDAAELLMQYVDRISAGVADTYLAERDALVSEEERRTRDLLDRLSGGVPLDQRGLELAEHLGVRVEPAYAPFAVVLPAQPARRHATVAARLRRQGWRLAVTDGGRVVGLTGTPLTLADIGEDPDILLVVANPAAPGELGGAREDVVLLAEYGRRVGLRGRIRVEDHLMEVLLCRQPGIADRLRSRVVDPLADPDHDELLRTLRTFVAHDYNHAATSEALHVHRNTVSYRLRRVEELTGLDLTTARHLALAYLAVGIP
ncbi:MAG TPA: helix-turn-helix domain-containing protein [Actinophytocola sp.]|uniref:PucR family transcriptional regulator n=1 Tax=Actinophytocola sp. TaxID=1872138 RepID=UPI002DDCD2E8|nr:helix-turn-helix domain-containing protein [Actinophytocola sp.]HEV2778460.1 helix-turn-helix domain-containing protein [Actinophytocola sp.]